MERFNTQHTLRTLYKYCELDHLPLAIIDNMNIVMLILLIVEIKILDSNCLY